MADNKPSTTMEQLRALIGSDGDEHESHTAQPAPAASPLGTDDEAGGTTPSAERVEMARRAEERFQAAKAKG